MSLEDLAVSAGISLEDRALLEMLLAEEGIALKQDDVIPRAERGGDLPLSFAQERLWFVDQLAPGNSAYNMGTGVRLSGELDLTALSRTMFELARRHEPLRTVFAVRGGRPVQIVNPPQSFHFPVVDLSALPPDRREATAQSLGEAEGDQPFDLATGPLLRTLLLRLQRQDHIALLTMHHIVSDGWSTGVLVSELGALYAAVSRGLPSPLPELSIQYADFAAWQRRRLEGEVLEKQIAYWRQHLAGATTPELPSDRPRPAVRSFRGALSAMRFGPAVSEEISALARRHGATPFMVFLTALGEVIHRHTGQDDVSIGTTIANRNRRELEGLIGFFVNTLAMRVSFAGDPTFDGLVEHVKETSLAAYANQDLPFERLVGELGLARDLSRSPLFQVVLQLQNAPQGGLELPGLKLSSVNLGHESAKFDFVFSIMEGPRGFTGGWRYSTDLYDESTVLRLSLHLRTFVAAAVAQPARPLSQLPMLSPAERHQLTAEWAAGQQQVPADSPAVTAATTLHGAFAAVATSQPEATALIYDDERLSYGELDRRSDRLARRLLALGAGAGTAVALLLERSVAQVVAILGTLKAGSPYVPIDPSYPSERIEHMLGDSGAAVLVTESATLAGAVEQGAAFEREAGASPLATLCLDGERAALAALPAGPLPPSLDLGPGGSGAIAYVIYTSGSTGRPKGVGVTHANVLRLLTATDAWFGFGPDDVWTLFHSYAFDFSVWELWGALARGGRLAVVPYWVSRAPEDFYELLCREEVTVLNQTPSAFRQLLWAEDAARSRGVGGLSLRYVIFGGEALELRGLAPWFARHGDRQPQLVNMYGITETTVHVTYRPLSQQDLAPEAPVGSLIGRPIPDLSLHLLDRQGRPVAIGVTGELHVGGAGVATGYLGRPELTAERFVPDPFAGVPGARLYRSGDLARHLADGDLEYLGRGDQQVKVRGFRIELGEIEAALLALPEVREAVVVAREEARGERRLVAYAVLDPQAGPELTLGQVRERLAGSLPDYMLPAALVLLPAMPLTANGKVDRRALPVPAPPTSARHGGVAGSEVERFLAALFREVLALPAVGLDDDFFELGGDSIKGAVLINRLQQELREIVHVVAIFDAPTVAKLAAHLVAEHPRAVARLWGNAALAGTALPETGPDAEQLRPIDEADLALFRELLPPRPVPRRASAQPKNPRAIFVLAPPRSGTTLLRVLLGGHPRLFAPPELELLGFDTLAERRRAYAGRDSFWLQGAVRAVMESVLCTAEEAERLLEECEREGMTTRRFYGYLQEWLGERTLVDKTPSYALEPAVLARAEAIFEEPFYIHLLRHPRGMIRSFEEARLDQIFFRREHPFSRRQLAELIWVASHENIGGLLARVPQERQWQVRFEDLVRDPEGTLKGLAGALGLDFHPDMVRPYEARRSRMTDGPHAESRMLGDVKFHQHGRIDAGVAERWREAGEKDFLGEPTRRLAADLSYVDAAAEPEAAEADGWSRLEASSWSPGEPLPLSFAQERLWFLDRLDPGSAVYDIPAAFRLHGELDLPAMAASLDEIVRRHASLRTTFRAVAGRPVQVVEPAGTSSLPLPVADLGALPSAALERELRRLAVAEATRPFDLERGPLLRATLVRLAPAEHAALFNMHHIVSDGWSMGVLVQELGALYTAAVRRLPSPLPEPAIQYVDFALWQRARLSEEALAAELAYWRQALAGLPVLDLPTDRPRPPVLTTHGATSPLVLPAPLANDLLRLGRAEGATPFIVLLAGFAALLQRWSGQDDVAIGTPVANRTRAELEGLIGFFVNTLVLRATAPEGPTSGAAGFRGLLARIRHSVLGAFAHQEVPFERVVEELQPRRDPSRSPLFQVLFTLQNASSESLELPGLALSPLAADAAQAKFDLMLSLAETPVAPGAAAGTTGPLVGGWTFNRDLFDGTTVERMSRHLHRLLAAVVADLPRSADRPLAELPLLDDAEREQLLVTWNRTAVAYPDQATVPELFAEIAAGASDRIALVGGDEHLTYAGLEARAAVLARRLTDLGVGPEVRVGLCLERSVEAVVAALGILTAGGVYVPIDPDYPAERLGFLLRDAGVAVLVAGERQLAALPATTADLKVLVLCLDGRGAPLAEAEPTGRRQVIAPSGPAGALGLAYVLYTSGSTGQPKGVAVPHRAIVRLVRSGGSAGSTGEGAFADLGAEQVFLQMAPLSFDASTLEIWGPLLNGGRLIVAPPGLAALEELGDLVTRHGISTLWLTAGLFHQMVEEGLAGLSPLRQLLAGGDTLSPPHVRRALAGLPGTLLVNGYGPTENTTFTCCYPMRTREQVGATVPLGTPIANTRVYLLDRHGRPVPVGVAGELSAAGDGLARGYAGRPDLTAERFVPAGGELGEAPGARLYRTGDLARYLPDGRIEFLGRLDTQLKLRGFRIEPGEVEAVLAAHPEVREAAVLAIQVGQAGDPAHSRDKRLVAYVVPQPGTEPAAAALRTYLKERLPDYMVPSGFALLEALPLNANGKVDRRALAARQDRWDRLDGQRAETEEELVTSTPTEELLAGIWSEVLGRERVAADADFFELGGNSLLATQVAHRVRDAFGVDLPLRRLFERSNLGELAREIEAAGGAVLGALPPLVPVPRDQPLPSSFFQEWGWHLQGGPVSSMFNMPVAQRLAGPLDIPVLFAALNELSRRHEALRTHFAWQDGQFVQVVEQPGLPVPVVDISGLPIQQRQGQGWKIVSQESEAPFDMTRGPLTRGLLVRADREVHIFLLNLHHGLSDGWSSEMLSGELATLYGAYSAGQPSPLPEPSLQYGDFAHWQRQVFQGERLEAQLAYWRKKLADLPPVTEVPPDRPRPAAPSLKARSERLVMMGEAARLLRQMAQESGCTLSMALLTAVSALLRRYTGKDDILVSTLFSGRNRPELAGIAGIFLNTVTLRTDLSGNPTFRQAMQRVRADMLEGYTHQDLPFPILLGELFPDQPPTRTLLSRVAFNMLSFSESPEHANPGLPGLQAEPYPTKEEQAKHDFVFTCQEDKNHDIHVQVRSSADLFDNPSLEDIVGDFASLVEQAAFAPDTPLDDLLTDPYRQPVG